MFLSIHSENSGYRMPSIICDQSAGFIICFIKMIIKRLFPIISKINLLPKKALNVEQRLTYAQSLALRPRKAKSSRKEPHYFSDAKAVRAVGGKGGDGCVSFLQLWCNERAGPDGGDGGSGGHIILQASNEVKNLNHVTSILKGEEGESGKSKDCHGKNAKHTIIKVPIGTIVRDEKGRVVGDLDRENLMFVAARGGAGGKGNRFFTTTTENSPKVCEYGPSGEDLNYILELRSMAHVGFIGFPNAGKSTLLNAITRAKPKIAPYAFTTLRPHLGMIQFDDHDQIAVADLPGLIPGSHLNKGLGIKFLKHAERCAVLLFVLDSTCEKPWEHYKQLIYELRKFSKRLVERPQLIVANKIDVEGAKENIRELEEHLQREIIPISAKMGTNISHLLNKIRENYEKFQQNGSLENVK